MADREEREAERAAALDLDTEAALDAARRRRGAGRLAVLSDVHANLEALSAVLADVHAQGITDLLCLGGIASYGPDPVGCVDLLRERSVACLAGSYDVYLRDGGQHLAERPRARLEWGRRQLLPRWSSSAATKARWAWFTSLPQRFVDPGLLGVHGTPADPTWGHLPLGPAQLEPAAVEEWFAGCEGLVLCGVLGMPTALLADGRVLCAPEPPPLERAGRQAICPGSVGQPRDRDVRASYAIVSEEQVVWRRVPYDLERTCARMVETGLAPDDPYVARLRAGI